MKIHMFPGQGAQSKGMGGGLFDRFPQRTAQADAILGYSIRELCLEDPREELGNTRFTQPALYVVNALSHFARLEDDGGVAPDIVLGHSLGEFDALLAAGCFDFETGLRLVKKRGELMSQASGGAMAAILNASREDIEQTLAEGGIRDVYLANYNSPSQIVISGAADEIARAQPLFKKGRTRFYPLNTSGAFHSRFMHEAMVAFGEFLGDVTLSAPMIPVIANVTARPYEAGQVLDTLSSQIANTVQWSGSVQYLLALARSRGEEATFHELGPGEVLTNLVDAIRRQTPDEVLDGLVAAMAAGSAADTATAGAANTADAGPSAQPPHRQDAADKVRAWNLRHPAGTRVRSTTLETPELETRTEAMVLFGHRAAVYMAGYNGYFDLDELQPVTA